MPPSRTKGGFKIEVRGQEKVSRNLNLEMQLFRRVGVKGTEAWAFKVLADAISLTPHDTGELIQSGDVREHPPRGGLIGHDVVFTADHAIPVHEINKNYVRGQWKYLETAWKASGSSAFAILIREASRLRWRRLLNFK